MAEKAPQLVSAAERRATRLQNMGWSAVTTTYRYGPKGTGSARAYITAERGIHGVTLEYLFRLNSRYGSPVKFLGGFWDGGPIRGEKDFTSLARPLKATYNHDSKGTSGGSNMATATKRPAKRVAKKAAAADETNGKAPARRRGRPPKSEATEAETFDEEAAPKERRSPRDNEERKAARHAEWDETGETISNLRAEGKGWDEICEELDMSSGLAAKYLFWHEARQEDGYDIPEATPENVRDDRESGMSWPRIEVKYDITRQKGWKLLEEAGVDHFESDIGKGGRYIRRDPDVVEQRRADAAEARKANGSGTGKRGRPAKFKGFTDETPDEDVMNAVEGKKITWNKTRGDGTDEATVKSGTMEIVWDKRKPPQRGLKFSDGRKARTVYVNKIISVG